MRHHMLFPAEIAQNRATALKLNCSHHCLKKKKRYKRIGEKNPEAQANSSFTS